MYLQQGVPDLQKELIRLRDENAKEKAELYYQNEQLRAENASLSKQFANMNA
jgi:cell division protein FtsB